MRRGVREGPMMQPGRLHARRASTSPLPATAKSGSPVEHPGALLVIRGVSKQFGGTHALIEAGLEVGAGEIVALLGENGAGKSTLIKILAGVYALDSGSISYRHCDVTHALRHLPIAF